jgi:CRP/FNR family transcriptional regulator, cyclic AMP receptor protein
MIVLDRREESEMDEARLRSIPLFAGLSRSQRRQLARCAEEISVKPGTYLCREGEVAYEFFAIEEGCARVVRGDQYLNDLGPGDFFGEIGLIEHSPRNASVIAESSVTAMVLTDSAFRRIDRENPEVAKRIRRAIDERCRWLEPVY